MKITQGGDPFAGIVNAKASTIKTVGISAGTEQEMAKLESKFKSPQSFQDFKKHLMCTEMSPTTAGAAALKTMQNAPEGSLSFFLPTAKNENGSGLNAQPAIMNQD